MKKVSALAAILSAAALTGGVMLASMNAAQACRFAKNKGITTTNLENSPAPFSRRSDSNDLAINKKDIIGGGLATVGALLVAGMLYKARRSGQVADTAASEVPSEESLAATSFPIPIPGDALSASTSEQELSDSTSDRDLTLVG